MKKILIMTSTLALGAVGILELNQPAAAENSDSSDVQLIRGKGGGGGGGRGGGGGGHRGGGGGHHGGGGHRGGGGGHHGGHGGHHGGHGGHHGGHGGHHGGHDGHGWWGPGAVGVGVGLGVLGSEIYEGGSTQCDSWGYDAYGNAVCLDY